MPRYTSYPSAAHFQTGISSSVYERSLKDQPEKSTVSIYVHIPFCRSLCQYCGCFTRVVHDDNPVTEYIKLLEREVNLVGDMTEYRFSTTNIHFGGGSPNLMKARDLEGVLSAIDTNFKISGDAEIAMECDPRQMTADKALDYAVAGINRVSLGVQDFNDKTQRANNRVQPFYEIATCSAWLREAGIKNINFDLMYGLPYQTVGTVADNAFKAVTLGADRIALFGYAHVPWLKPHQKVLEKHPLPDAQERYDQAEAARSVFIENGYLPIGMDHFAKPADRMAIVMKEGKLHRNFQGYTTDNSSALLGFGLSAISHLPEMYAQNTSSFGDYREMLDNRHLPVEKGFCLGEEDRLRADIIEQLMCYFTVDVGEICKLHGFPLQTTDESLRAVMEMETDGLVETDGRVITVTDKGRYFVRAVCGCFDNHMKTTGKRYANAV